MMPQWSVKGHTDIAYIFSEIGLLYDSSELLVFSFSFCDYVSLSKYSFS